MSDEGRLLVSCDFSGQELRLLAHLSKCPVMLDAFKHGKDLHAITAVSIYNKKYKATVDYEFFQYCRGLQDLFLDANGNIDDSKLSEAHIKELFEKGEIQDTDPAILRSHAENGILFEKIRKNYAKMTNFAVIYGTTAMGLSDSLGVSEQEAQGFIDAFMEAYPGAAKWIQDVIKFINKNHYTLSMRGGKRRLHWEMTSGQQWLYEKAYRMGVNAIIQGSAGEMTKKAALDLLPLLKELDGHIVLFVHDEIIFDFPAEVGIDNLKRVTEIMCNAVPLDCGMKSDIEAGERWGQKMSTDELDALMELMDEEDE